MPKKNEIVILLLKWEATVDCSTHLKKCIKLMFFFYLN